MLPSSNPAPGTATGGDFYDGFSLPDGRITVAIGEVMGCDVMPPRSKSRSGPVCGGPPWPTPTPTPSSPRSTGWSAAWVCNRPAAAADGQDYAYACDAGLGDELFVTALLGVFDPATGELCLASAGQLPPAVVRHQNAAGTAASAQSAPGAWPSSPRSRSGARSGSRGSARSCGSPSRRATPWSRSPTGCWNATKGSLTQGGTTLLRTLSTMASTAPRSISQHVVDELIGGQGLEHEGALLVVVRDSQVHHMASVLVSPQASAVGGARRWVRGQLESWGLDEEVEAAAVMGVSELVTNVVLHAGTPARVSMELADRLLVTVEDTGTRGAPQPQTACGPALPRGAGDLLWSAAYSDAMGLSSGVRGSTVWFEIVRDPVTPSDPLTRHPVTPGLGKGSTAQAPAPALAHRQLDAVVDGHCGRSSSEGREFLRTAFSSGRF